MSQSILGAGKWGKKDDGVERACVSARMNTTAHFPLNFISSVSASEIAGWRSFPDAMGAAAIVLDSDNTTDSFALPVQTQTEHTICFAALIMHVTVPGERKKKEKPGEY